ALPICSGGTLGYLYSLDGGTQQASGLFTGLSAGTYTLEVEDANGCTATTTITITEPTTLTSSITSQAEQVCATAGSATVEGSGGTSPYTYYWPASAGGVVDGSASSLVAGNYDVTVEDVNGCAVIQQVVITDIGGFATNATVNSNVLCFGENQGEIELDILGGTPDYEIDWGSGIATTSSINYIITNLTADSYSITITDVNSCQSVVPVAITEPAELTISEVLASHVDIDCNGNSTGELEVSGSGGTPVYIYSLDGGTQQASGLFTGLAAGTYTLEVEDVNGCTATTIITITEPTALTISEVLASHVDVDCNGNSTGELEVLGSGGTLGYQYSLNGGTQQTSGLFTGLADGTYTLEVEDANGCIATTTITIIEPTALTISEVLASHVNVDCNGNFTGELEVAGSGGTPGYLYSLDGGTQQASGLFTGLTDSIYTLEVEDVNGCTATTTVTITEPTALTITEVSASHVDIDCNGNATGELEVVGSGGTPGYIYSLNGGTPHVSGLFTGLAAGIYTLEVRDVNGCTATTTVIIAEPTVLTISEVLASHIDVDCNGNSTGQIVILASGGTPNYTYSINGNTPQSSNVFTGLAAGNYTILAEDSNGCTATTTVTITEPTALTISEVLTSHVDVDCNGNATGELEVAGSGGTLGYLYSLDGGTQQASGLFTGLTDGIYTLEVEDVNGCTATTTVTITEPTALTITEVLASHVDVNCYGNLTGELEVSASGGIAGYQYSLNGGTQQSIGLFTGLTGGTYTLTVEDSNSCTESITVNINEPAELELQLSSVPVNCGVTGGSITASATGGTPAYTFNWPVSQTTNPIIDLAPGIYSVTVIDNNLCEDVEEIEIGIAGNINAGINVIQPIGCYGEASGILEAISNN
ncbi:MAG: SprB repeat-containing protein, partial [Bacteroidales bacterium]|nr:SprB repeat-containing protein [Bacteroidales bacterium]